MAKTFEPQQHKAALQVISDRIDALDAERCELVAAFEALGGETMSEEEAAEDDAPKLLEGPKPGRGKYKRTPRTNGPDNHPVEVDFKGEKIVIWARSERLLDLVESYQGQIVSKQEAAALFGSDDVLRQVAKNLRIALAPTTYALETVWGKGLRLVKVR